MDALSVPGGWQTAGGASMEDPIDAYDRAFGKAGADYQPINVPNEAPPQAVAFRVSGQGG